MAVILVVMLGVAGSSEQAGTPAFATWGIDQSASSLQAGGNMEGKEVRFGIANSVLWATATTAASNGSVNSMHDSFTPIGGLAPMWLIQLGEVVYGGRMLPDLGPNFVEPTIIKMPAQTDIVKTETFAPILYLLEYGTLEEVQVSTGGAAFFLRATGLALLAARLMRNCVSNASGRPVEPFFSPPRQAVPGSASPAAKTRPATRAAAPIACSRAKDSMAS